MFEFVEELLDDIALSVNPVIEGRWIDAARHWANVGPCATVCHALAKRIGIIGPVGQKDVAVLYGVKHVLRASTVLGLAFGEFEQNGQACRIDQGVDLGGQAARPPRERPMQLSVHKFSANKAQILQSVL